MSHAPDILLRIAADRAERVRRDGPAQGMILPTHRELPLTPFAPGAPFPQDAGGVLIAEVKRRSPSKGSIATIPDPAELAGRYKAAGFRRVSVLTEEARFGGSLSDLAAVKEAHPDLAVLRKDFLLTADDVDVSCRAGADAVLLIAALLDEANLSAMYRRAIELGLSPLVEVHTAEDAAKIRKIAPPLVGINSRDLRRFTVEPLIPLETRVHIDWPCRIVYESGISRPEDVMFVRGSGFSGFLVGESAAKRPGQAAALAEAWKNADEAARRYGVWQRLYRRLEPHRGNPAPLVKICGITSLGDAEAAEAAGADIIGFVFADSPRQADDALVRDCAHLSVLKAAVVVLRTGEALPGRIADLLRDGLIDIIQFHGDESSETLDQWPSFKAMSLKTPGDAELAAGCRSPAVLVDGFSPDARGGTGRRLDDALLTAVARRRRLWLAGGLDPDNVGGIAARWNPGLVDVSSGVTLEDGTKRRKDHGKMKRFVAAAKGLD